MPHIHGMTADAPETIKRPLKRGLFARACMFWGGLVLVIVSPLVGILPGPGGIFVFAAGFALMLRGSTWVKKKYVRFKKSHPKKGDWVDFGLRRLSYRRRQERAKAQCAGEGDPAAEATVCGESARGPGIPCQHEPRTRRGARDPLLGHRPPDRGGR